MRVGYSDVGGDVDLTLTSAFSTVSFGPIAGVPDLQQFSGNFEVELGALGGNITIDSAVSAATWSSPAATAPTTST